MGYSAPPGRSQAVINSQRLLGDKELSGVGVPITLSDCGWPAASAQVSAISAATAIRRLAAWCTPEGDVLPGGHVVLRS